MEAALAFPMPGMERKILFCRRNHGLQRCQKLVPKQPGGYGAYARKTHQPRLKNRAPSWPCDACQWQSDGWHPGFAAETAIPATLRKRQWI